MWAIFSYFQRMIFKFDYFELEQQQFKPNYLSI